MATNQPTDGELRQRQIRRMQQQHPSSGATLIHYALDLETPPLIACEAPDSTDYTTVATKVTCPDCMSHDQFPQSVVRAKRRDQMKRALFQRELTEPPIIRANDVLMVAADLLVDADDDYTKAIVDMTSQLIGAGPDDSILMTRILRSLAEGN